MLNKTDMINALVEDWLKNASVEDISNYAREKLFQWYKDKTYLDIETTYSDMLPSSDDVWRG